MKHVAIYLPETSDYYFVDALQGIVQYARSHGPWHFSLSAAGDVSSANLRDFVCDGVILADDGPPKFAHAVPPARTPVVNIARPSSSKYPGVAVDDQAVGRLVASHFLNRGFRNFGYYTPYAPARFTQFHNRYKGFSESIAAAGHTLSVHQITDGPWGALSRSQERTHTALEKWLQRLRRPVAIMAATDVRGRHILMTAAKVGVRVPEDAAVIGVDNSRIICDATEPALSSVQLDGRKAGYEAAGMLDRLMHGQPSGPSPVLIPPLRLVERRSSDVLAMEDRDVAAAVRFIAENARRAITVDQVVAAVPVARRMLERRFRGELGRSVQQEIQRVHVERAKILLADEAVSIAHVAAASGFKSQRHLSVAFRRNVGMTPSEHRRRIQSSMQFDL